MKKTLCGLMALGFIGAAAEAQQTVNYGWEDGATILGSFGNVGIADNVSVGLDLNGNTVNPNEGSRMLYLTEDPVSGTPQAFVALITDLNDGDEVTASFYGWDFTPDSNNSMRIWGHYIDDVNDIDSYAGSASGNSTYTTGPAEGAWDQVSHTWTVDFASDPDRVGLVVEARLYSGSEESGLTEYWVDTLSVTAPDGATILTPVPEPSTFALGALAGLALTVIRRRKA